jgi:hypothetical protein
MPILALELSDLVEPARVMAIRADSFLAQRNNSATLVDQRLPHFRQLLVRRSGPA